MKNKKYEFTGETKVHNGKILKRIRRISDGLVGGWIEKEDNLSHLGTSFVYENGKVYDEAYVSGDGMVTENGEVYNYAVVCKLGSVSGNAKAHGDCTITGWVSGEANVKTGTIIGEVQIPFKEIEFYRGANTLLVSAIKTLENQWLFNVGCQELITKEEFIDRIYNEDGGLELNPHRKYYLKILSLY